MIRPEVVDVDSADRIALQVGSTPTCQGVAVGQSPYTGLLGPYVRGESPHLLGFAAEELPAGCLAWCDPPVGRWRQARP